MTTTRPHLEFLYGDALRERFKELRLRSYAVVGLGFERLVAREVE